MLIGDVDFKNSLEEEKFWGDVDLSGKVDFVLADPPYNVRRHQKDNHMEYSVSGSKDMKDTQKVPGDVMKPVAQGLVFYSALQFALCYKELALEKTCETVPVKMCAMDGLRAKRARV